MVLFALLRGVIAALVGPTRFPAWVATRGLDRWWFVGAVVTLLSRPLAPSSSGSCWWASWPAEHCRVGA